MQKGNRKNSLISTLTNDKKNTKKNIIPEPFPKINSDTKPLLGIFSKKHPLSHEEREHNLQKMEELFFEKQRKLSYEEAKIINQKMILDGKEKVLAEQEKQIGLLHKELEDRITVLSKDKRILLEEVEKLHHKKVIVLEELQTYDAALNKVKHETKRIVEDVKTRDEELSVKEELTREEIQSLYYLKEKLKEKEYFVLGDNRLHSSDSRSWGLVNKKLITGRVLLRAWPLNKIKKFESEVY